MLILHYIRQVDWDLMSIQCRSVGKWVPKKWRCVQSELTLKACCLPQYSIKIYMKCILVSLQVLTTSSANLALSSSNGGMGSATSIGCNSIPLSTSNLIDGGSSLPPKHPHSPPPPPLLRGILLVMWRHLVRIIILGYSFMNLKWDKILTEN